MTIAAGKPGELRFVQVLMHLRALDHTAFVELQTALLEMEAYYKDIAVSGPDDNSTFTAKGRAQAIKAIRGLTTRAVEMASNTRPGA